MSSPSEGIMQLLTAAGVGVQAALTGWSMHISSTPDQPDTAIGIYDSGGKPSNPRWLLNFPSIQIRVRGNQNGYLDALAKCKAIDEALLGLPSQDINGDRWVLLTQISPAAFMGYDTNRRPMFSINYQLTIEPAAGTYRDPL